MTREQFIEEIEKRGLRREERDSDVYWKKKLSSNNYATACAFTGKFCALHDGVGTYHFRLPYELVSIELIDAVAGKEQK